MALPGLGRRGGCSAARLLGLLATPSAKGWFLNVFLIFFRVGLLKQSTDRMADVAGGLIAPLPFLQRSVVAGIWMRSCVLGSPVVAAFLHKLGSGGARLPAPV